MLRQRLLQVRRGLFAVALLLLAEGVASAQTPPPVGDDLGAMQAEIVRLRAAIADLSDRLDRLAEREQPVAAAPVAPTVVAPPTPSSPTPPRFDFYGESLVRLASIHQTYSGCAACPSRTIGRLRIRFGAEGRLAPGFRAVIGLGIGEVNDPNTIYQTLGGNLTRKAATWDRGYVVYEPPKARWLELQAGKFPYPWVRSSMTFDVDFYPEGASERATFGVAHLGPLKRVSVQGLQIIVNEQPTTPDTMMIGGQATGTFKLGGAGETRVIFTGLDIKRPEHVLRAQFDGTDPGVRNTNAVVLAGTQPFYASGFRYANLIVEQAWPTPWPSVPVMAALEYQRNLRAISNRHTAHSVRVDAGRQQRRGDWAVGWHFFHVEEDAIMSALGESDWRAPSNVVQHRFAVNRMIDDHVQLLFTWYRGRTLDAALPGALTAGGLPPERRDPWTNRLYFDVRYSY